MAGLERPPKVVDVTARSGRAEVDESRRRAREGWVFMRDAMTGHWGCCSRQ